MCLQSIRRAVSSRWPTQSYPRRCGPCLPPKMAQRSESHIEMSSVHRIGGSNTHSYPRRGGLHSYASAALTIQLQSSSLMNARILRISNERSISGNRHYLYHLLHKNHSASKLPTRPHVTSTRALPTVRARLQYRCARKYKVQCN